jgi:dihydrofolate reductase
MIKAILACDENWGIGKAGTLPWPHKSEDLQWFRRNTMGHMIVMGRNTWNAPGMPKPLIGRLNVVITTDPTKPLETKEAPHYLLTLDQLPDQIKFYEGNPWSVNTAGMEVFVIGGAGLVESMLDQIDEIWLSCIDGDWDCDTFLPKDKIKSMFERDQYLDYETDGVVVEKWYKRK